eukprot:10050382-Ditylum_brightwellii.AAC.1
MVQCLYPQTGTDSTYICVIKDAKDTVGKAFDYDIETLFQQSRAINPGKVGVPFVQIPHISSKTLH